MKTVFIDSSSAILLFKVDLLEQLTKLYQVRFARSVYEELVAKDRAGANRFRELSENKQICILPNLKLSGIEKNLHADLKNLGMGERDTILEYSRVNTGFIILDDGKAAKFLKNHQISFINALIVPKILAAVGEISETKRGKLTDEIIRFGRYADWVIQWVENCDVEPLKPFFP